SSLVTDLNTSVTGVQTAITLYTLVMASFMIAGGKLGDVWGRLRTYRIGLIVYAIGSTITAFSPNLLVLMFGWSILEGLGAVLIMPAVVALIAGNFSGKQRATAFAAVAAAAATAAAVGPIIGGAVTTFGSWRYVFIAEAVLCLVIFAGAGVIKDSPASRKPRFDGIGAVLSALALGLIVLGVLQSSSWGWISAKGPIVDGEVFAPLNLSLVFWMIAAGLLTLSGFFAWNRRQAKRGRDPLLAPGMLRIPQLTGGLGVLLLQMLVVAGLMFIIPLYVSVVLGKSALETGLQLLPMSVALVIAALGTPKVFPQLSPRRSLQAGLILLAVGATWLAGAFDADSAAGLGLPLVIVGLGVGLISAQIGNIIVSSVPEDRSSEAGGLQFTAQNLGASLGTALLGAVLIGGLATSVTGSLEASEEFDLSDQDKIALNSNIDFVSDEQLNAALASSDLTNAEQQVVRDANETGRIDALRRAVGIAAIFPLVGLFLTRRIPNQPLAATAPAGALPGP
ncbi:MAG: MFS transporter, partial [Actinomycetia bacterium]|nr:MFS transporter [Actinomycetes bacterium]